MAQLADACRHVIDLCRAASEAERAHEYERRLGGALLSLGERQEALSILRTLAQSPSTKPAVRSEALTGIAEIEVANYEDSIEREAKKLFSQKKSAAKLALKAAVEASSVASSSGTNGVDTGRVGVFTMASVKGEVEEDFACSEKRGKG
eukprot:TRINITY_DN34449_c0_g1_i1.p1 TRINITY_DN34449_c0_g1~~TRINITY_DN34449_c0_g1_i1.p1  ORF type:complete len:168 (+),score=34.81 TRINITY_DN34449_c0_g1_i1:60-506(+)